jgi:mycothiol synthase
LVSAATGFYGGLMALTERSLRLDDAAWITAMLRAAEAVEPADEAFSEEEILDEMTRPGADLQRGSVAVFDGAEPVAFGALEVAADDDAWRAYLFGAVEPGHRHRGIGTRIVELLVDQARVWRDADRPDLPGELKMWVPEPRRGTAALAGSQGFASWRWFIQMRRELADPVPAPDDLPGYLIRTYTDADAEDARAAYNDSFADHWGSSSRDPENWRRQVVGTAFQAQHSYLALDRAGTVVGFVIVQEHPAETETHGFRTGYVHLVGTLRSARGQGIASTLLSRSLTSMAAAGYRRSELTVDAESPSGAGRIYERLGYQPFDRAQVFGRRF